MSVCAIVQARMTSTRLPGKVLKLVMGKPLLAYQVERIRRSGTLDQIVIATTVNESDQPIVELCELLSVPYVRGSEHDVLSRYYHAAVAHHVDVIVRITSDCPLIDPVEIDRVVGFYSSHASRYDYVANGLEKSYPLGMSCEVFPYRVLEEASLAAKDPLEREHVTLFIKRHPDRYRLGNVRYREDQSHHRWTVDTEADFQLVKKMIEALYPKKPNFSIEDCLALLEENPEWQGINAHVKQRTPE